MPLFGTVMETNLVRFKDHLRKWLKGKSKRKQKRDFNAEEFRKHYS